MICQEKAKLYCWTSYYVAGVVTHKHRQKQGMALIVEIKQDLINKTKNAIFFVC